MMDTPTTPELSLLAFTPEELTEKIKQLGQPAFRAKQLLDWIWKKKVSSPEEMLNLPTAFRQMLTENFCMRRLTHVTTQGQGGTRKFLYRLTDGHYVESVLIPASQALYGEESDRQTLCVSSQVGCAFGCKFCASGMAGFIRNLDADEIVEQIIQAEALSGLRVNNIVFMGMGEPLSNWDEFTRALDFINAPWGLEIGARHLTLSSAGHAPHIRRLADDPRQIRLAISLHGATDEVRNQIMPINKKWPLPYLFESLDYWVARKKQMITFEFILIDGLNNTPEQAKLLAAYARRFHAKVNLIPYNTVEGLPWKRPSENDCYIFRDTLKIAGIAVTMRIEKGGDIDAACGQLRLKRETDEGLVSVNEEE